MFFFQIEGKARAVKNLSTVRNYGTVRLNFGKKLGAELRTVFSGKLQYGTKIRYLFFPYRTLSVLKVLTKKVWP